MRRHLRAGHATWTNLGHPLAHCVLLALPILTFSIVLMILVEKYEFKHHHRQIAELSLDSGLFADVYYVDLSATKLITVASLSSSAVLTLMGSFMTLLSYSVAADLIWTSNLAFVGMLPNPAQLALLVDLLDAKKMAMCQWLLDVWSKKFPRKRSLWVIELAVATQLLVTAICIAITGIDAWLHLSTESVTMPYVQPVNPIQAGAAYQYSRKLSESCAALDENDIPCSITLSGPANQSTIQNRQDIDALIMNHTSAATRLYIDRDESYVYIGPAAASEDSVALLQGAVEQYPQFNASTLVSFTTCSPSTCSVKDNGNHSSFSFRCEGGFARDATDSWLEVGPWYQNSADEVYAGYSGLAENYSASFYGLEFGIFAHLEDFKFSKGMLNFPGVESTNLTSGNPSTTFVLYYSAFLGTSSYTWANNSLENPMDLAVQSDGLFDVALGPLLSQGRLLDFPRGALEVFHDRLNLQPQNNTQEQLLTEFEFLAGGIALSFLGASIESSPANSLQLPNSTIVTQVPKLPLFTLITLNIWYAGLAICICSLACILLSRSNDPNDIVAVRQLLTVNGLTQAAIRDYCGSENQNVRVGVVKKDGQWYFKVWPVDQDDTETVGLLGHFRKGQGNDAKSFIDNERLPTGWNCKTSENLDLMFPKANSARPIIRSVNIERGHVLREDSIMLQEPDCISPPISPISYTDDVPPYERVERRRVPQKLAWAEQSPRL